MGFSEGSDHACRTDLERCFDVLTTSKNDMASVVETLQRLQFRSTWHPAAATRGWLLPQVALLAELRRITQSSKAIVLSKQHSWSIMIDLAARRWVVANREQGVWIKNRASREASPELLQSLMKACSKVRLHGYGVMRAAINAQPLRLRGRAAGTDHGQGGRAAALLVEQWRAVHQGDAAADAGGRGRWRPAAHRWVLPWRRHGDCP